ncbi:MAG: N-acetylgalactosamine-N, N-diacetylbacillosaminyl-diphospho-undecaprenol [Bacteroidota bacterium]|jgi:glycosyltransferase involved in cell wall biosynthesis
MNNNRKIAIVSASLGVGGAERFAAMLGTMFHGLGYNVHHIIILDVVAYDYQGQLVNLGKMFAHEQGVFRAVKKGKYIARYLHDNQIDTIIDLRSRPMLVREIFTQWIYGQRKTYFMVHSANLEMYFPKSRFWAKYLYAKATKIVTVSKAIEQKVQAQYGLTNTKTIYNPVIFPDAISDKPNGLPTTYFLFFGRLEDDIKNLSLLLDAYAMSEAKSKGVHLVLLGDGSDKNKIAAKIQQKQLGQFVTIIPFQKEVLSYIQHAKATLLTSRFEGFPMSLIESLAAGTPVISVDCESGPSEIVQHGINGLLVENHNPEALANAMNLFMTDENLYRNCKNNAKQSVEHLSLNTIAQAWQQLLNE